MSQSRNSIFKPKVLIGLFGTMLVVLGVSFSFNSFYNPSDTNFAKAAPLVNADLTNLAISCDSVKLSAATTSCKFDLPSTFTLPVGFALGFGDPLAANAVSGGTCTAATVLVTCTGVPLASSFGLKGVFVKIGANAAVNTTSNLYIQPSGNDFAKADFSYSPTKGSLSPLFRSSDVVTVTVKNFKTNSVSSPAAATYNCNLQARAFQPKSGATAWVNLGTNIAYDPVNGCSAQITKQIRGSGLNWSIKANIVKISDATQSYDLYDSFVYRFQGAGTASGV